MASQRAAEAVAGVSTSEGASSSGLGAAPLSGRFRIPHAEVQAHLSQHGLAIESFLVSLIRPASKLARPPVSGYYVGCVRCNGWRGWRMHQLGHQQEGYSLPTGYFSLWVPLESGGVPQLQPTCLTSMAATTASTWAQTQHQEGGIQRVAHRPAGWLAPHEGGAIHQLPAGVSASWCLSVLKPYRRR